MREESSFLLAIVNCCR